MLGVRWVWLGCLTRYIALSPLASMAVTLSCSRLDRGAAKEVVARLEAGAEPAQDD